MSRLETFLALNPIDYIPPSLGSYILGRNHSWPSTIASSMNLVTKSHYDDSSTKAVEEHAIFPGLPPLLVGHPDMHIRNGIMKALRLADAQMPDSEKAFFVADLSQIYQQHKRWKACLPEITPFYGRWDISMFLTDSDFFHYSYQMQPRSIYSTPPRRLRGWL
jgi:ornithine decarboxylase